MLIDPNTRPNKLLRGCLVADLGGGKKKKAVDCRLSSRQPTVAEKQGCLVTLKSSQIDPIEA